MKSKILFFHHSGNLGGAPKSLSYILGGINHEEFDAKVMNIFNGPGNDVIGNVGVPLEIVSGIRPFHGSNVSPKSILLLLKNFFFLQNSIKNAKRIIKKENPDIVYLNSTCLFPVAIAAKKINPNLTVICHVREPIRKGIYGLPLRFFSKKYVDGFIAISAYDMKSLNFSNSFNDTKVKKRIIHNFVEKAEFTKRKLNIDGRKDFGINKKDIVFLYLARFSPGNGWEKLISYAREIVSKDDSVKFILAGANDNSQIEANKYENIILLPFIKNPESLIKSSNIFVCPFEEPHFSRGVIEASSHGVPILASDVGSLNELVLHGKTGYLYSNKNEFLKFAWKLIKNEELREGLGDGGIEFSKRNFSFDLNLKMTYDFIEDVRKSNI
ncbi:glycosyltransferase family 4 protein [Echinicola sp. CAU 1574]|uniref:Glycosyltransferase family 4 protein n=1 Tax=Echinicola arenosa TaxID=2774144 RepID=A0ABR9AP43_9BACT|nr:glycosyltransferase family 4 protein [Echinicola arenosa]MBD8490086.1 glycosyltransferase family 4 protein [Echinicola arenosa]